MAKHKGQKEKLKRAARQKLDSQRCTMRSRPVGNKYRNVKCDQLGTVEWELAGEIILLCDEHEKEADGWVASGWTDEQILEVFRPDLWCTPLEGESRDCWYPKMAGHEVCPHHYQLPEA